MFLMTNSSSQTPSIPDESISRPKNASKSSMWSIRKELGYDKIRWNAFRSYCRDAAMSAHLNWDGNWKSQRSDKLSMAYNAIEEAFPETRRFEGQWAIDRAVKQYWDNRKTYRSCVGKGTTYRGRQAAACRASRAESPGNPTPSTPSPQRMHSPPRSNNSAAAGPSRPRARPLNHRRISDSDDDDDDEDEFVAASDGKTPHNDDAGDEQEEEDHGKSKSKGKRKACGQGGKNTKRARGE
ncbi:hypothetical protein C8R45DRAFT_92681 [Mycena sanguinolenta]|nr:hypothetical protein C8R45DRAFT_92681 [Mycena sanguinolenta]